MGQMAALSRHEGGGDWGGGRRQRQHDWQGSLGGRWVPRGCSLGVCIGGLQEAVRKTGWQQAKVVLESNTLKTERANGYRHQKLCCCLNTIQ